MNSPKKPAQKIKEQWNGTGTPAAPSQAADPAQETAAPEKPALVVERVKRPPIAITKAEPKPTAATQ